MNEQGMTVRSEGLAEMANQTSNAVNVATKVTTYGGSAGAVLFGLTANEMAAVSGVVIGLLGLLVTVLFKFRDDRRNAQRHALEMRRLQREVDHHV